MKMSKYSSKNAFLRQYIEAYMKRYPSKRVVIAQYDSKKSVVIYKDVNGRNR